MKAKAFLSLGGIKRKLFKNSSALQSGGKRTLEFLKS